MENEGTTTRCIRCGKETSGPGPKLCDDCQSKGFAICENCGIRVANGTTPYCDQCAEEIVGTG
jgi:DNA-directed RNA polymerase subunit RPC12/RpoP